jgi:hypothetical protein
MDCKRYAFIFSIEPIKPLQIGATLLNSGSMLAPSSKFSGPPKTLSPLLVPKVPVGIRDSGQSGNWSLKYVSGIPPKMVDCGTSTDDSLISSMIERRSNVAVAAGGPSPRNVAIVSSPNANNISRPSGNDMWNDRDLLTNGGDFSFRAPWSLLDIDEYIGKEPSDRLSFRCEPFGISKDNEDRRDNNGSRPILTNGGSRTPNKFQQDNSFKPFTPSTSVSSEKK